MDDMDIKKRYLYHEKYYLGSTSRIPHLKQKDCLNVTIFKNINKKSEP